MVSDKRGKVAQKLAKAVQAELPDLKLDRAVFGVECARAEEGNWGPEGMDRVQFVVSTNPQTPAGPLHKIASGGELARFMLALKVILAATGTIPTLVFDEVDSASAARLRMRWASVLRNSAKYQILVVTHSPQVAARAGHHWHVAKTEEKGAVITRITPLLTVRNVRKKSPACSPAPPSPGSARAGAEIAACRRLKFLPSPLGEGGARALCAGG